MAVIQISKIQLRRGPQAELPGAPTSLAPLAFSAPLEPGEMGYATDTGRLFIGHEPVAGQPNHARTSFPYQNLEVLTEASTGTLRRIVGNLQHETGAEAFRQATLIAENAWNDVRIGDAAIQFGNQSFMGFIDYALSTSDGVAIRVGQIRMVHVGGGSTPNFQDDYLSATGTSVTQSIDFRITRIGGTYPYLVLQYRNRSADDSRLFFRVTRIPA